MGDFEPSCNIAASEGNQRVPVDLNGGFPGAWADCEHCWKTAQIIYAALVRITA